MALALGPGLPPIPASLALSEPLRRRISPSGGTAVRLPDTLGPFVHVFIHDPEPPATAFPRYAHDGHDGIPLQQAMGEYYENILIS